LVRLLRQLSAIYVIAAGVYSMIVVLNARPDLAQQLRDGLTVAGHRSAELTQNAAQWTKTELADGSAQLSKWIDRKRTEIAAAREARRNAQQIAELKPLGLVAQLPVPKLPAVEPRIALSTIPDPIKPRRPLGLATFSEHAAQIAQAPQLDTREVAPPRFEPLREEEPEVVPQETPPPSAGEIARVQDRLRGNLTGELYANFDLFLYVSKAERGPWAQRMYVFDKQGSGDLAMLHAWPVSTGRPARALTKHGVRYALDTPSGYYQLDPNRFHAKYTSVEWGMPMPYAMFFDWVKNGNQTGLAIHGVEGEDIAMLGMRASAGCIRLAPENAKVLFNLIKKNYRGPVPRFAYDTRTSTMSNDGILWHDRNGQLKMDQGYRVLVFIENYGGENVVAALY